MLTRGSGLTGDLDVCQSDPRTAVNRLLLIFEKKKDLLSGPQMAGMMNCSVANRWRRGKINFRNLLFPQPLAISNSFVSLSVNLSKPQS